MTFFEWFYKVIILQGICVLLVLLSVVAVKYFFKEDYKKIESFYRDYVAVDTNIDEVLSNEV